MIRALRKRERLQRFKLALELALSLQLLLTRQALLLVKWPVLALALFGTVPRDAAPAAHHVTRLAEVGTRRAIMAQASLEPTPVGPEAGPTLNGRQSQAETCGIHRSTNGLTAYFPDNQHPEKLHPNDGAYVLIQG